MNSSALLYIVSIFFLYTVTCEPFRCDETTTSTSCTIRNYTGDGTFQNFELHTDFHADQKTTLIFVDSILEVIPSQIFDYFINLIILDLRGCNVKNIPPNTFYKARNLKILNLSNNLLSKLNESQFEGALNLVEIDLVANEIKNIDSHTFKNLNKLLKINLANNIISNIQNDVFTIRNINELNLEFNQISNGDVFNFTQNGSINLNNNYMESIHLDNTKGKVFYADNNRLDKVTTGDTEHFIYLSLKNNSLTSFDFIQNMSNLYYLDLSYNPLRFVRETDSHIFKNLINLKKLFLKSVGLNLYPDLMTLLPTSIETLDISSNNFDKLDFITLSMLDNLEQLFVNDNHLGNQTFSELKFLFTNLKLIDISQNDWQCWNLKEVLSLLKQLGVKHVVKNKLEIKSNELNIKGIGCVGNLSIDVIGTSTPDVIKSSSSPPPFVTVTTQSTADILKPTENKISENNTLFATTSCESNSIGWFIALLFTTIMTFGLMVGSIMYNEYRMRKILALLPQRKSDEETSVQLMERHQNN